jgi:hypothetical protein
MHSFWGVPVRHTDDYAEVLLDIANTFDVTA